jgi:GT2 family glycosyltransferase
MIMPASVGHLDGVPAAGGGEFAPARVMDVEFAGPLPALNWDGLHRRVLVTGRLHTEPVGVCILPLGRQGLTPDRLGALLWTEFCEPVGERFADAGLAVPGLLTGDGLEADPAGWPFLRHRWAVLAAAPFISVVLCTRDRPHQLETCLRFLARQEYPRFEVVVVDNAPSTGGVRALVNGGHGGAAFRYILEPRAGLSWARNAGAAAASGEIIAYLDDDEEPDRHWLAGLACGFARGDDIGCVSGMVLPARLDTAAQELFEQLGGHRHGRGFSPVLFSRHGPQNPLYPLPPFGVGANLAFRREALARIGGFDVALGAGTPTFAGEDTLALTMVLLAGYRIAYEPAALMRHRHRGDLDSLAHQLRGYGVGLTAFYTALVRHRPRVLLVLLRLAPAAVGYLRGANSAHAAAPRDLPAGLKRRQRRGMITGPVAYLRSVRKQSPRRATSRRASSVSGSTMRALPADGTESIAARAQVPRQRSAHGRAARHAAPARSLLPVGGVALAAATGVLLVAAAYTAGRLGRVGPAWADRAYWLGQALILVPAATRLLSRRFLTAGETVTIVVVLTVAEYFVKICYSPAAFTYADELEHWRSTVDLLQTGRLFTVNYVLPISPRYPGLEEVTAALGSVTGLPLFAVGLVVAGVAHLLFVCVLYLLFRDIGGSYRLAGVAMVCYAANSLFTSFDSMFVYQTLALPFLALTLLAAWRLAEWGATGQRTGWLTFGALAIAATVVTHHVTSFVLVATLTGISLAALLTGRWRQAAWPAGLALLSAAAVAAWLAFASPQTLAYLRPYVTAIVDSVRALLTGGHVSASAVSTGPLGNRILAAAAVLAISALLPAGWWRAWRRYRRQPWAVAMAIGSAGWYAIVAIRLTVAHGSELAGRAATFVFVPMAFVLTLAVIQLVGSTMRWKARAVAAAMLVTVLLLMFDGLANGWPPYWERLPGAHQVAGSERSVGAEEIATARWALAVLGPGNRFATDRGSYPVLGSYGDQNPGRDVAYLYTSPTYSPLINAQAHAQALRYVWVDRRLSQSLPAFGQYFPVDPKAGNYTHPLAAAGLDKFNKAPGVERIYDSGDIVIYDLAEP